MTKIECLYGDQINPLLEQIGKLRIQVFKEFPYLYEGSLDYEINYLSRYAKSESAALFIVRDNENIVGMSSCVALSEEEKNFQRPFLENGYDLSSIFYFGESILLPKQRGKGLGKQFFKLREDHARKSLGKSLKFTTFCAVNRELDHPLKPPTYNSPEPLWNKMGYIKNISLVAKFSWPELGQSHETEKELTFWLKEA